MKLRGRIQRAERAVPTPVSFEAAYEKFERNLLALSEHWKPHEPFVEPEPLSKAEKATLEARGIRGVTSWLAYVLEHEAGTGASP